MRKSFSFFLYIFFRFEPKYIYKDLSLEKGGKLCLAERKQSLAQREMLKQQKKQLQQKHLKIAVAVEKEPQQKVANSLTC